MTPEPHNLLISAMAMWETPAAKANNGFILCYNIFLFVVPPLADSFVFP